MNEVASRELTDWMADAGWSSGMPSRGRGPKEAKCVKCRRPVVDELSFVRTDVADGPCHCCVGCARAWYEGDPAVAEAAAVAGLVGAELDGLRSCRSDEERGRTLASPSSLSLVARACATVTTRLRRTRHDRAAEDYLDAVARVLPTLPAESSMPLCLELLSAGFGSSPSFGAGRPGDAAGTAGPTHGRADVAASAMAALLGMAREQAVPRLTAELAEGLADFDSNGSGGSAPTLKSWNAAVLLAEMGAADGRTYGGAAAMDLLCLIETCTPGDEHRRSGVFPYAGLVGHLWSRLPDGEVTAALARALDRRHGERREYVAMDLAERAKGGNERAVAALLDVLATEVYDNPVPSMLIQHDWYDADPGVRLRVVRTLLGDPDAVGVLLLVYGRRAPEVVIDVLGQADDGQLACLMSTLVNNARNAIGAVVGHPRADLRLALARGLAEFVTSSSGRGTDAADSLLRRLADDEDAEVRQAAARALTSDEGGAG